MEKQIKLNLGYAVDIGLDEVIKATIFQAAEPPKPKTEKQPRPPVDREYMKRRHKFLKK